MPFAKQLQKRLEHFGWDVAHPDIWTSLETSPPQVAILAPPLDTVPSFKGNAIYVLVETLASKLPIPCVVLAYDSSVQLPSFSALDARVLYYRNPIKPVFADRLPYRMKRYLFGSAVPGWITYAHAAAQACL